MEGSIMNYFQNIQESTDIREIHVMKDKEDITHGWYMHKSMMDVKHRSFGEIFFGLALSMYDSEARAEMPVEALGWKKADIDLYSTKFKCAIDVRGGMHYSNENNLGEDGRDAKKERYFTQRGSRVIIINETNTLKQFKEYGEIVKNGSIEEFAIWRNVNSKAHLCKGSTNKSLIIATNQLLREITGDQRIDITEQADILFEFAIKLKFGVEAWNCM